MATAAGRPEAALHLEAVVAAGRTTLPLLLLRALVAAGRSSLLMDIKMEVTGVNLNEDMRRACCSPFGLVLELHRERV